MKIAVIGDSKVSEKQWDLTLKYNPNLTEKDKERTWINQLRADGHKVDVYSRMSGDNSWMNDVWDYQYRIADNGSRKKYDRIIMRPANINTPPFNLPDHEYDELHSTEWQDLGVQFSGSSNHDTVKYYKLWDKFTSRSMRIAMWKTFAFNWTYDKHKVLLFNTEQDRMDVRNNNYLFLEGHWQTEYHRPQMHLIKWNMATGGMSKERQDYLKGFRERNPGIEWQPTRKHMAMIYHKHFNHITFDTHDAIYKYLDKWIHTMQVDKEIDVPSYGMYEWPCPIMEQIEEEIAAGQR